MWFLIGLGIIALGLVLVALRTNNVWPLGALMLEVAGAVVYLLLALWPVRLSDLPPWEAQACAVASAATAAPGGTLPGTPRPTPTSRPTPTPAPTPTPTATVTPSATPSGGPAGTTAEQQTATQAVQQAQVLDPWVRCSIVFGYQVTFPFETRLLIIIALAAALGAFVHVASSFSAYLGTGTYDPRWLWYYVLRIPVGVSLAYVFYFAIRGGILTTTSPSTGDVNPFGLAAIAGLVGLFSKQASDKLEEVFKTMFRTESGNTSLTALGPSVISINPPKIVRSAPQPLKVSGANFKDDIKTQIDGRDQKPDRKDDRNLTIPITAADVAQPKKKVTITLINVTPESGTAPARSASYSIEVDIEDPAPPQQQQPGPQSPPQAPGPQSAPHV